ncbi:hypothetical protein GF336_05765 [Candidatus Woesearchaeota archaeon]|nr:hypothetical protein [Candidatus Woesearchaeota archaeon]
MNDLRKKWSEKEISEAKKIIDSRHLKDKSRSLAHMNKVIYWTVLLVMIIGNFIVSMALIPFLLLIDKLTLNVVIVFIGLGMGLLFNLLINDIEHIDEKHHYIAAIMLPLLAVVNFFLMMEVSEYIGNKLELPVVRESALLIGLLYAAAFLLPYLRNVFFSGKLKYK